MPSRQTGSGHDRVPQPGQLLRFDARHRHALHDEVHSVHVIGIGVDGGRIFDADFIVKPMKVWNEQFSGLDRLMSLPATADDKGLLAMRHSFTRFFRPTVDVDDVVDASSG